MRAARRQVYYSNGDNMATMQRGDRVLAAIRP